MTPKVMNHVTWDYEINSFIIIRQIYEDKTFSYCECDDKGITKSLIEKDRNKSVTDPSFRWIATRSNIYKPRKDVVERGVRKKPLKLIICKDCGEHKNIHNYYFDDKICNKCFKKNEENKKLLEDKSKKECRYCRTVKAKEEFEECELFKDGYRIYCKECEEEFIDSNPNRRHR